MRPHRPCAVVALVLSLVPGGLAGAGVRVNIGTDLPRPPELVSVPVQYYRARPHVWRPWRPEAPPASRHAERR